MCQPDWLPARNDLFIQPFGCYSSLQVAHGQFLPIPTLGQPHCTQQPAQYVHAFAIEIIRGHKAGDIYVKVRPVRDEEFDRIITVHAQIA
ncbi:hypothetical protein GCM10011495_31160 [Hymenobacter frigidus]|uniref:Uncharacterized protein n=1 Tax=Hymenobacter frigidus TaxID=1524095 RepID=A0ABQ2ACL5_9BACT|nr:hypothetical protein GCM10011495_31160 [Hymenobacter frigidus]